MYRYIYVGGVTAWSQEVAQKKKSMKETKQAVERRNKVSIVRRVAPTL